MRRGLEDLLAIHERAVFGDPTASADLFIAVHKPMTRVLYGRHRLFGLSWEEAGDLATDAIVSYLTSPDRFDPSRASLFTYLSLIANRDALNLIRRRSSERKNLARLVELSAAEGNTADDSRDRRLDAERLLRAHINEIAHNEMDRRLLELMLKGERDNAAYASVLGVNHLTTTEQRSVVRQHRDKLEKRMKRLGERL